VIFLKLIVTICAAIASLVHSVLRASPSALRHAHGGHILQGAIGMFSGILSSDSEIIVFERKRLHLFFSAVPARPWRRLQAGHGVARRSVLLNCVQRRPPIITWLWRDR